MIVYIDGMDFRRTGVGRVMETPLAGLIEQVVWGKDFGR